MGDGLELIAVVGNIREMSRRQYSEIPLCCGAYLATEIIIIHCFLFLHTWRELFFSDLLGLHVKKWHTKWENKESQ